MLLHISSIHVDRIKWKAISHLEPIQSKEIYSVQFAENIKLNTIDEAQTFAFHEVVYFCKMEYFNLEGNEFAGSWNVGLDPNIQAWQNIWDTPMSPFTNMV